MNGLGEFIGRNHFYEYFVPPTGLRSEEQGVEKNNEPGPPQVLVFRIFKFSVDLRQRFFARHREKPVTESHQDANQSNLAHLIRPD